MISAEGHADTNSGERIGSGWKKCRDLTFSLVTLRVQEIDHSNEWFDGCKPIIRFLMP